MPRRNLIPLCILAALAVLTALFAVLAIGSSPDTASLAVQNATGETFGEPTGSTSFSMELVSTLSAGSTSGTLVSTRLVDYVPPDRMAVFRVKPRRLLAVLDESAITCALEGYTAMVSGSTPWTANGSTYTRSESLMAYAARVPHQVGNSCTGQESIVEGTVYETAVVKSGYLVGLYYKVVVPPQELKGGTPAAHGTEGESIELLQINGTPTSSLG
jgi:hypothetical protein